MSDEAWEGQMSWARCDELLAPVRRVAALLVTAPPAPGALLPALSEEEHLALGEELVDAVGAFYLGVRGRRSA